QSLLLLDQLQYLLALGMDGSHRRRVGKLTHLFRAEINQKFFRDEPMADFPDVDAVAREIKLRFAFAALGEIALHRPVDVGDVPTGFPSLHQLILVPIHHRAVTRVATFHLVKYRWRDMDDLRLSGEHSLPHFENAVLELLKPLLPERKIDAVVHAVT